MSNPLFDASILCQDILAQMPAGYEMRPLALEDYEKGYLTCLEQLAKVGPVTREQFIAQFTRMHRQGCSLVLVIEDVRSHTIVATGTLVIEQKFLRGCSSAGHIEDIVVDAQQRGTGFGARIIKQLMHMATVLGCYKVLLNCEERVIGFYERCGLSPCGVQMKRYLKGDKAQSFEACEASKPAS
ncbi:glucosamine 6-phosphate N-acetyltransferase [Syncephalis pseudoplumigaleata]|uniref:Glucosamine 6-phosphate N-acetyltransferase n=1 Tax=Syncephalis pseudoplumigaleata TaxID=1712513 RepID=A0A4P9Z218_9FUNG|nr:glucosamine 6-phosphate N-acetyltransferase [Syncephalis pseudoplumigaleata]|eukprot:RKP26557.1 glucosamine 6-phosphate N-acetyltransferase [Syncephalis pseudoplumigaleata]